jgi:hypothetical protein
MSADQVTTLNAAFDDYPQTQALKRGDVRSDRIAFKFSDVKPANKFFKPMVREQKFDVSEMAIGTFLMAKAYGKPLVLMPATIMGRFQHNTILCRASHPLTPADLAGIKLRMPPGEFWQFLGESIGANPTPVAYAELYTALQSGTVDGQDNPLVAARTMKFYEVTSQFVLTSHVIGYDMLAVSKKAWTSLKPAQQTKFKAQAERIFDTNAAKYDLQEQEAIEFFKSEGKQVYAPDQSAFRTFAQKRYLEKYSNEWPKGAIERINAVK